MLARSASFPLGKLSMGEDGSRAFAFVLMRDSMEKAFASCRMVSTKMVDCILTLRCSYTDVFYGFAVGWPIFWSFILWRQQQHLDFRSKKVAVSLL